MQNGHMYSSHDVINYHSDSVQSNETLYIMKRLVENNNTLVERVEQLEAEKQDLNDKNHHLTSELSYRMNESMQREDMNKHLKLLLSQASHTIAYSEEDYQIMQKQVQILTKKLQLMVLENQTLSATRHTSTRS
jgi:hypothetical protein